MDKPPMRMSITPKYDVSDAEESDLPAIIECFENDRAAPMFRRKCPESISNYKKFMTNQIQRTAKSDGGNRLWKFVPVAEPGKVICILGFRWSSVGPIAGEDECKGSKDKKSEDETLPHLYVEAFNIHMEHLDKDLLDGMAMFITKTMMPEYDNTKKLCIRIHPRAERFGKVLTIFPSIFTHPIDWMMWKIERMKQPRLHGDLFDD